LPAWNWTGSAVPNTNGVAKIREHALQKVPFQLVVGDKEVESGHVNVRVRGQEKAEGSAGGPARALTSEKNLGGPLRLLLAGWGFSFE